MKRRRKKRRNPSTAHLVKRLLVGLLIILLTIGLLWGVWYITNHERVTISEVDAEGGNTIPMDDVEAAVLDSLEGEYFHLVPRTFSYTYPEDDIEAAVRSVPRVKDVHIDQLSNQSLMVTVEEYEPYGLWCGREDTNCLFVDNAGYAFATAPQLQGNVFTRYFKIGSDPTMNNHLIEAEQFTKLQSLLKLFDTADWAVSAVEIDQGDDAYLTLREGGELKISLLQSPEETVENFLTLLGSAEFAHLEKQEFKYVDLRFGKKIFVNETTTTIEEDLIDVIDAIAVEDLDNGDSTATAIMSATTSEEVTTDQETEEVITETTATSTDSE